MTRRSEIKAALAMVVTEVEASMLVMPAIMVGVRMMSVVGTVKSLLVELMMVTVAITRVKLVAESMWPKIGSPPKHQEDYAQDYHSLIVPERISYIS